MGPPQSLPSQRKVKIPSFLLMSGALQSTEPDDIRIYMSFDNIKSQHSLRGAGEGSSWGSKE